MKNLKVNEEEVKKVLIGKPSMDRVWLEKYYSEVDPLLYQQEEPEIPAMSMYQLAEEYNRPHMKDIAIDLRTSANGFSKGIQLTYQDFFQRIHTNAKASKVLGVQKDEIMPILLPNVPEARTLIYSNSILGAVSYPISPLLPVRQLEQLIEENHIRNLVIFGGFYSKYESALHNSHLENIIYLDGTESLPKSIKMLQAMKDKLTRKKGSVIIPQNKKIIPWDEYQKYSKEIRSDLTPFYEEDHVTAIIGTSGTTGSPKGVQLTDRNINAAALNYLDGKVFEGKTFLDALLPSIGYGISMLHYQTIAGKYVYLLPELLTTKTAQAFSVLKPDHFPGGPVHYINLSESKEFKQGRIPDHLDYISGGATLPHEIERKLNGVGEGYVEEGINNDIVVRQGYGLSENVATGTYSKRGAYKFGSIGIPMLYNRVGIFKPGTDEELGYNEEGELCITGPCVMKGYLNNPEETDKVVKVHRDGKRWIHTKDKVYMDEDGHIFFVDRFKNIFMRTGFNVHPAKIAEYINAIPSVRNSAVIGFDHPKEQCVPIAFLELEPSALEQYGQEEIIRRVNEMCYANLEETSVPYDYVVVDTLPINAGGKIDTPVIQRESGIDLMRDGKVLKKELTFGQK